MGNDSHEDEKGFIWSLEAGFESFDIENYSYILGVNDYGHVIGIYEECDNDDFYFDRSFLYAPEYGFLKIEALGGNESRPYAINNHTRIVGTSNILKGEARAFIWDLEEGMRNLSDLIPKNRGWKYLEGATGINDSGYIVGYGKYYGMNHHFLLIPKKS